MILVTGAEGKLGSVLCDELRKSGTRVAGLDKTSPLLFEKVGDMGVRLRCDITSEQQVHGVAKLLWGQITGIACLAAIDHPPRINTTGEDISSHVGMQRELEVGVIGNHMVIEAFAPMLQRGASIVLMGSVYGAHAPYQGIYPPGFRKPASYSVVKGATEALARWWAGELGPRGIRVNCVRMGGVASPDHEAEFSAKYGERTMLGRMATPGGAAQAVQWLLSSFSSYVTGAVVPVDGGYGSW